MPRRPGEELSTMHPQGTAQQKSAYTKTVGRYTHFIAGLPSHLREQGGSWYPQVHEAAAEEARAHGISLRQAAGTISAVSPGMDFSGINQGILSEVGSLTIPDWKMIHHSNQAAGSRHEEVSAMLKEKAPGLSSSSDKFIMQAHDIYHGKRDPYDVLNYQTNPKRFSFMHNIEDPEHSPHVTIDYRAHDLLTNRMMSVGKGAPDRGIQAAGGVRGGLSRYEVMAQAHRDTATALSQHLGEQFSGLSTQATGWVAGKDIETMAHTQAGHRRKKGVTRELQPYMTPKGRALTPSGEDPRKAGWWE